ncbi:MAG: N-acetyl-gamma-glutamyl-phosphate reductase, partial [Sphingomonas bacterium]|nr:N-acetyl-gamma-glutamyl-phosphate reductase [Sphingomonas bacterium]
SGATRVSNPGCYPTGFLALVRPLVRSGLLPADALLNVNATSGYSGGGKAMIAEFEQPDGTTTGLRAYALGLAHKHVPEMQKHAGLDHPPIFAPAVARSYRGMLVEVPIHLHALPASPRLEDVREVLEEAYRGSQVVRVIGGDPAQLDLEQCAGTDRLELYVLGNAARGQVRLVAALDNLGKGAAGAAVQNLNLVTGLDEVAGLKL